MPFITLRDSAQFFYKDWNPKNSTSTTTIVFSHGWPLSADAWKKQMFFFASHGYRVVAHDRRGHGRSEQTWEGNDANTWADDLSELIEKLNLQNLVLVGHSTGGGEVARYCGRHGTSRVSKVVFISSVVPQTAQSPAFPDGVPVAVLDSFRAAMLQDRAQFFRDGGLKAVYETTRSWEVDYSEDLKGVDVPSLVIQGDDDQIVPIKTGALLAIKLLKKGTLKVYPGGAHALMDTEPDAINKDLLEFIQA